MLGPPDRIAGTDYSPPVLSVSSIRGERSIGLGLAIARKIVEAHGGRMFVDSEPGEGAVFGCTLPVNGGL